MNIALSGKLASGKSVLAQKLTTELGYCIISIGTPIKKATNLLIENKEAFERYILNTLGPLKGDFVVRFSIQSILKTYAKEYETAEFIQNEDGSYVKNGAYRALTQLIATELREAYGEDVWAIFAANDSLVLTKEGKRVICDDLRLPSEKEIFESYGYNIIRLDISEAVQKTRIASRGDGVISDEQLKHTSEIALDHASFDFRINTDQLSIEEVIETVLDYVKIGQKL